MPASIGVNLRVTGHCRQGGRKYMEDFFSVAYQQTDDERDLEYAFFGIYDGHGGSEAAAFAKEHLMETIIKHKTFWSDNDEDVLRAIKDGYIATHYAMWKEQEKWPRTASGLPSTAGTTASVAFIRHGKIYIGHVGDSAIILGYQEDDSNEWKARPLTTDHKPENVEEMIRISQCGGKVVSKSGVPRVVWNRPKMGHQGPVRRSTPIDEIPFLAVARSLGDLWSYNSQINQFIVSPDPDCSVIKIDTNLHKCLIFGTDGLFNMLTPQMAVSIVQQAEKHNEYAALNDSIKQTWLNPSKLLVEKALERWHSTRMRADNTSVVTLILDPPGPPRAQVLKNRKKLSYPNSGLKIVTRFEKDTQNNQQTNNDNDSMSNFSTMSQQSLQEQQPEQPPFITPTPTTTAALNEAEAIPVTTTTETAINLPLKEHNFVTKPRESLSFDPRDVKNKENTNDSIQINEISSSSIDLNENDGENLKTPTPPTTTTIVETIKHNLRKRTKVATIATTTTTTTVEKPVVRGTKRKSCDASLNDNLFPTNNNNNNDENIKLRKSSRIEKIVQKSKNQFDNLTNKIVKMKKLDVKKRMQPVRGGLATTTTTTTKKSTKKSSKITKKSKSIVYKKIESAKVTQLSALKKTIPKTKVTVRRLRNRRT